jgi:hypothetical protein
MQNVLDFGSFQTRFALRPLGFAELRWLRPVDPPDRWKVFQVDG